MFVFLSFDVLNIQTQPLKLHRQNPAPTKDTRDPYVLQKSFTRSFTLGVSTTDVVKLALVVTYPRVGLKTLTLASWMNFDEKIEPTDIFTSIGMIYRPILALLGTCILKGAGAIPKEERLVYLD
jgi:hypothetical protein